MTTYDPNSLITGNNLILFLSGTTVTPLAFSKSCDLTWSTTMIDTTNTMSGVWKTEIAGQMTWSVQSEFLYSTQTGTTNFDALAII